MAPVIQTSPIMSVSILGRTISGLATFLWMRTSCVRSSMVLPIAGLFLASNVGFSMSNCAFGTVTRQLVQIIVHVIVALLRKIVYLLE